MSVPVLSLLFGFLFDFLCVFSLVNVNIFLHQDFFFCNLKHVEYVPRRQELRVTRNTEWLWKKGG